MKTNTNMRTITLFLNAMIGFVALAVVSGCSRSYDLGDQAADSTTVDTANPSWSNGISAVIQNKCVNCHTPAAQRSKFVPGNTPASVDTINLESYFSDPAKASLVQRRVFTDTVTPMPPIFATPLSDNEKTALSSWIATKAVNLTTICGSSGTSAWSYADAAPVIAADCGTCHTGASLAAFSTLAKVQTYRSSMLQYLNLGTMPQSNTTYKNSGNGALLFQWLCFGSDVK